MKTKVLLLALSSQTSPFSFVVRFIVILLLSTLLYPFFLTFYVAFPD